MATTAFTTTFVVACNSLVGFGDLEKVNGNERPDPLEKNKDSGTRDSGGGPRLDASQPIEDASRPVDADAAIPPASTTCPASAATYYPPYQTPAARSKPCNSGDLSAFLANERQLFDSQRATMVARNAACASCIYTIETEKTVKDWGPMTKTQDSRSFIDFGLCYRMAGASDQCGAAAHDLEWCLQKVCNVCTDGVNLNDCRAAANGAGGTCEQRFNTTVNACQGFGTIVNQTCLSSREVVGIMCGGL
jgi:hypothetical protein